MSGCKKKCENKKEKDKKCNKKKEIKKSKKCDKDKEIKKVKKCSIGRGKSDAACCCAIIIAIVIALAVIYFGAVNDGLLAVLVATIAILVLA